MKMSKKTEKISLVFFLGLTLAMITANVFVSNGSFVLAKDKGNSNDNGGDSGSSSSGSGDSGSSGDNGNGGDSGSKVEEAKPSEVNKPTDTTTGTGIVEETGKPITPANPNPNPNPTDTPKSSGSTPIDFNCHFHPNDCKPDVPGQCPGGFSSNDKGNCFPSGPCPPGFGRHDDDESGTCFKGKDFCHFHDCGNHHTTNTIVKVIHKTKVIHKNQAAGIATVFVPGIGLVEPFNCKLNADKGKIGCEFAVIKVIT